jgi:hypothetical protein
VIRRARLLAPLLAASLLAACGGRSPVREARRPADVRAQIARLLPANTAERNGWAADIHAAFDALELDASTPNLCAAIAVAEQESGLTANPLVPNLGRIARAEIEHRAAAHHVPAVVVRAALQVRSPDGKSFGERIDAARTERDLSAVYEDLIGEVPLGRRLLADANPVRTAGAMQVSVAFAERHAREHRYPYALRDDSIRHELFTRRGGLYFGIAHLLGYRAPYDRMLYRFADFNAGRYASRNAAFQAAVSRASGVRLALDGDLVPHDGAEGAGATERAVRKLAARLALPDAQVAADLRRGDEPGFEDTALYQGVFALADALDHRAAPRAVVPQIALKGPKISHRLTTAWYANRVEQRYEGCVAGAARTASTPAPRAARAG